MALTRELAAVAAALALIWSGGAALPAAARHQGGRVHIVVVAGEDAVNVIQQKTAVAPIVEVRDENDQPVAGVLVRFAVRGRGSVNGLSSLTATTNAAGQATVPAFAPASVGPLQIDVTAINGSQTATATINQTTYQTTAQASQASRPGNAQRAAKSGGHAGRWSQPALRSPPRAQGAPMPCGGAMKLEAYRSPRSSQTGSLALPA